MVNIRFLILIGVCLGFCALFLGWQLRDPKPLILSLRATKLGALLVVGAAVGAGNGDLSNDHREQAADPRHRGF